ncbi:399_t:CDS:2 [Entrophospora sp. SA101]|nr:399_t:CDS:2 [Entrophospora sp. SA101]
MDANYTLTSNHRVEYFSDVGPLPGSSVWNHFTKGEGKSKGKHTATCLFCNKYYPRGTPNELESHLVTTCIQVPSSLKEHYLRVISNKDCDSSDKKRKIESNQRKLTQYRDSSVLIPERKKKIDAALLRFFICCGVPFSIVESPFFIELTKQLHASYDPPTRKTLSKQMLNSELATIVVAVENELHKYLNHDKIRELMLFAIELWADMGHGKQTSTRLVSQIHLYREKKPPYDLPYDNAISSYTWWNLLSKSGGYLQEVALKLYAITPHSAGCERVFSILSWFYNQRRNNLDINRVKHMAIIHNYYISNEKKGFEYFGMNILDEEIYSKISEAEKLLENEDNEEIEIGNDENNEEIEVDDVESNEDAAINNQTRLLIEDYINIDINLFNSEINSSVERLFAFLAQEINVHFGDQEAKFYK